MTRKENQNIAANRERLRAALTEPRTMRYLVSRFKVARSTIHRWLADLEDKGDAVIRVGAGRPVKYKIS